MDANTAASIQACAAVAQVVFALVLVAITAYYARVTGHMAKATGKLVEQSQNQRYDAALPVVLFRLSSEPWSLEKPDLRFTVEIVNAGCGPARDIVVEPQLASEVVREAVAHIAQPFVLAAGEHDQRKFLVEARWFSDDSSVVVGQLRASYRDIFNRWFCSYARLICTHPLTSQNGHGGPRLEAIEIEGPYSERHIPSV